MNEHIYFFTQTAVDDYHLAEEDLYFNVLNNAKTIYLYKDTVARYKKQILKGNTVEPSLALMVAHNLLVDSYHLIDDNDYIDFVRQLRQIVEDENMPKE